VPIGAVKLVKILKCKLCSSVMRRSPDLLCELFTRPEVAERPSGLAAWIEAGSSCRKGLYLGQSFAGRFQKVRFRPAF
jgi:hypothetical protein